MVIALLSSGFCTIYGHHFKSTNLLRLFPDYFVSIKNNHTNYGEREKTSKKVAYIFKHRDFLGRNHIKSPSSSVAARPFFFSSWIFNPSPRISLHNTSNDTGVPASNVLLPLTIDS